MKTEKWTQEEIASADGYYHASDHETEGEKWSYVADMMYCADFPKRTAAAYQAKMRKVWNQRQAP